MAEAPLPGLRRTLLRLSALIRRPWRRHGEENEFVMSQCFARSRSSKTLARMTLHLNSTQLQPHCWKSTSPRHILPHAHKYRAQYLLSSWSCVRVSYIHWTVPRPCIPVIVATGSVSIVERDALSEKSTENILMSKPECMLLGKRLYGVTQFPASATCYRCAKSTFSLL